MTNQMVHIDNPEDNDQQLDDISYISNPFEKENKDPFNLIKISSLSPKMKRKAHALNKRHEGEDGTQSKYVDPEVINGYSLWDIVNPPYDLDTLAELYDQSAIHYAAINARVMNTVGLGYEFTETLKARRKIERAQEDPAKLDRTRRSLQDLKEELDTLFESFNIEETLIETLVRVWQDVLTVGNGYLEVGRNNAGKIGYIGHIPAKMMRVRRKRDGFVQFSRSNKVQAVFFRNFQDLEQPDPINADPKPNEVIHFKIYSPNNTYYGIPAAVSAAAAIVGDKFAKEYNIDYFENKAIPRYAIIIKGAKLSNQSKTELVNYFRNEVKGRNHGTLVVPLPASIGSNSDMVQFKLKKIDLLDEDMESRIYDRYLRTEVITPNEVRGKIGFPERTDGDDVLPFPTKVKQENSGVGAPVGNSNNAASNPPKSRSDSGATPTGVQGSGDQNERGQNQDSGDNVDTVKVFEGEENG